MQPVSLGLQSPRSRWRVQFSLLSGLSLRGLATLLASEQGVCVQPQPPVRCWLALLPGDCLAPAAGFSCKVAPCPVLLEPRLHTDGPASSLWPFPAILPMVVRQGSETAPSLCPVAHQCWPMESTSEEEPLCPQRPLFAGHLPLPELCHSATKLGAGLPAACGSLLGLCRSPSSR